MNSKSKQHKEVNKRLNNGHPRPIHSSQTESASQIPTLYINYLFLFWALWTHININRGKGLLPRWCFDPTINVTSVKILSICVITFLPGIQDPIGANKSADWRELKTLVPCLNLAGAGASVSASSVVVITNLSCVLIAIPAALDASLWWNFIAWGAVRTDSSLSGWVIRETLIAFRIRTSIDTYGKEPLFCLRSIGHVVLDSAWKSDQIVFSKGNKGHIQCQYLGICALVGRVREPSRRSLR